MMHLFDSSSDKQLNLPVIINHLGCDIDHIQKSSYVRKFSKADRSCSTKHNYSENAHLVE